MKKYKVIIIGAGPSGIATSLSLKKYGIDEIMIIERAKFPRFKCCAGYVTNKTKKVYEQYGLNFDDCNYSLIDDFNIFYNLKSKIIIKNKFMYTNNKIDRVELDYNFYKLAKENNININEKENIIDIDMDNNIIKTNVDKYEYDYLVFADRTNGFGSRFQKEKNKNIAVQYIFESNKPNEIQIHFGITKHGYAWVSSYDGITNIGLTDVYNKKNNYNEILNEFANKIGIEDVDNKKITGAFTPIGTNEPIINNNIYYVGDAVGACDPFTLTGLRYSLSTGDKCAESICKNDPKLYIKFIKKINSKFILSRLIMRIFYLKFIMVIVFDIACKLFKKLMSFVFNNVFVSKK